MSSIPTPPSTARRGRRLAAWLAFGAVGLATGAVWATGFDSVSGTNGTPGASPALAKTAPDPATSALSGKVTDDTALTFDWAGRWGKISADTNMFKVNLSGSQFAGKTYNIALLLANTSQLTGWASMQFKIENVAVAAGGACTASDLDGTNDPKLLNVDDQDAGVYWNGVAGDAVYCLGIATSPGDEFTGTFLRSAQDTPPTAFPTFVTTVDRAS